MRNHGEKTRDVARSVLPSTTRSSALQSRAGVRSRLRAQERQLQHELLRETDQDEYEGDLTRRSRCATGDMVEERREGDKLGSLKRWAECLSARSPDLSEASPEYRAVDFRSVLPKGLVGEHAISHLWSVFDDRPASGSPDGRTPPEESG